MNKNGFQVSFAWLFALIVGAVILSIAIFAVTSVIDIGETQESFEGSEEIYILINPLETGVESARINRIKFPEDTRLVNKCFEVGAFGEQGIGVSQEPFGEWTEESRNIPTTKNKYFFSESVSQESEFVIFSKPFDFPFKVADLTYFIPANERYCFSQAPDDVKSELSNIGQENIFTSNCTENMRNVCFGQGTDCHAEVFYSQGIVRKDEEQFNFNDDGLMFAAIFSDKEIYECQVRRLMKRTSALTRIYADKASIVSQEGCNTNLRSDLLLLDSAANNLESSSGLESVSRISEDIKDKNRGLCELW